MAVGGSYGVCLLLLLSLSTMLPTCTAFSPLVPSTIGNRYQQQQSRERETILLAAAASGRGGSAGRGGKSNPKKANTSAAGKNKKSSTSKRTTASSSSSPLKPSASASVFGKKIKFKKATPTSSSSTKPAVTIVNSQQQPQKKQKQQKQQSPPWQVLSDKDAKKNIAKEKQRRELARQLQEQPQQQQKSEPNDFAKSYKDYIDDEFSEDDRVLSKSFLSEPDRRLFKWKRFQPVSAPHSLRLVGAYLDEDGRRLPSAQNHLGVPEIAFLGRSNVGKSSLLNTLLSRSNKLSTASGSGGTAAVVGKTPGATATVNLYELIDEKKRPLLVLADLPGYGYAKLSKQNKASVQAAAEHYLSSSSSRRVAAGSRARPLALGILLQDIRRTEPTDDDRAVLDALYDMDVPLLIVATKIDKLGGSGSGSSASNSNYEEKVHQNIELIKQGLGLPAEQPVLAVSSVTKQGIKPLWNILLEACESLVDDWKRLYEQNDDDDEEDFEYDEDQDDAPPSAFSRKSTSSDSDVVTYYDDEEDDIEYDQGYDWNDNDSFVLQQEDDDKDGDGDDLYDDDDQFDDFDEGGPQQQQEEGRQTLKTWKKKVREMERRGEI